MFFWGVSCKADPVMHYSCKRTAWAIAHCWCVLTHKQFTRTPRQRHLMLKYKPTGAKKVTAGCAFWWQHCPRQAYTDCHHTLLIWGLIPADLQIFLSWTNSSFLLCWSFCQREKWSRVNEHIKNYLSYFLNSRFQYFPICSFILPPFPAAPSLCLILGHNCGLCFVLAFTAVSSASAGLGPC